MIVGYARHFAREREQVESMKDACTFIDSLEGWNNGYALTIEDDDGRVLWERHGPGPSIGWHRRAEDAPGIPEDTDAIMEWEPPPPPKPPPPMPNTCPECGARTVSVEVEQVEVNLGPAFGGSVSYRPGARWATCENDHQYGPAREGRVA